MARTVVTTAKGKTLDMTALKSKNEKVIPLGNKVALTKKEMVEAQRKASAEKTVPPVASNKIHSTIPCNGPVGTPQPIISETIKSKKSV